MIPINSIIISKDNVSFNTKRILYSTFDNFIPIFTESLSEKDIGIIINCVKRKSLEIYNISKKTLISLFEDYKNYRIKERL